MRVKKKQTIIILIIFLLLQSNVIAGMKKSDIVPVNKGKQYNVYIAKKQRKYYLVQNDKTCTVVLKGSGALIIYSRAVFSSSEKKGKNYQLIYNLNKGKKTVVKYRRAVKSKKAVFKDGTGAPGKLKKLVIELGRGVHKIDLLSGKQSSKVIVRFKFTQKKLTKTKWTSLNPVSTLEPVELSVHEDLYHYFKYSQKKPLKINIIGPVDFRVMTRLEFKHDMMGKINYRIQVKEDGKVKNTFLLYSKKSKVAQYKNNGDLIPGIAQEFVVSVPKGKHVYDLIPLDKDKSPLLGRVLIQEKDIVLTKKKKK